MISCQVCGRTTEMAQRSNRRFPNLISVAAPRGQIANREESGRNPSWPGVTDSTKGRIHWRRPTCHRQISLANKRRTIHTDIGGYRLRVGRNPVLRSPVCSTELPISPRQIRGDMGCSRQESTRTRCAFSEWRVIRTGSVALVVLHCLLNESY
jgi:hypothetical protein